MVREASVTVYVDGQRNPYRGMVMCHMIADSHEELLAMVDRIGVARCWIQDEGTAREHFDVCLSSRKRALAAGAVEISTRALVLKLREREGGNNWQRSDYSPKHSAAAALLAAASVLSGNQALIVRRRSPESSPCAFHTEDTAQTTREPDSGFRAAEREELLGDGFDEDFVRELQTAADDDSREE